MTTHIKTREVAEVEKVRLPSSLLSTLEQLLRVAI
jgi:hypothetical protein